MLAVQVSYLTLQEQRKHNRETERQEDVKLRQNDINLALTARNIAETERANRAHEQISWSNLYETIQHNRAQEEIQRTQAQASLQQAYASVQQANIRQRELAFEQQKYREVGKAKTRTETAKLGWEADIARQESDWFHAKSVGKFINDIIPF